MPHTKLVRPQTEVMYQTCRKAEAAVEDVKRSLRLDGLLVHLAFTAGLAVVSRERHTLLRGPRSRRLWRRSGDGYFGVMESLLGIREGSGRSSLLLCLALVSPFRLLRFPAGDRLVPSRLRRHLLPEFFVCRIGDLLSDAQRSLFAFREHLPPFPFLRLLAPPLLRRPGVGVGPRARGLVVRVAFSLGVLFSVLGRPKAGRGLFRGDYARGHTTLTGSNHEGSRRSLLLLLTRIVLKETEFLQYLV
mmetsp:Transcript_19443/g.33414  ORF Transcript_19443/g.33414 Transcript_19443/m.33414 type:complete len:246 (-) Transcript_19443:309-1046(-)